MKDENFYTGVMCCVGFTLSSLHTHICTRCVVDRSEEVGGLSQTGGGPSGYRNIGSKDRAKLFVRTQLKSSSEIGRAHV